MNFIYHICIRLYGLGILFMSPFNRKARLWVAGRKNIFDRLQQAIPGEAKTAWFHCASLGEFEQGKPVMEKFRKRYPEYKILLTFFSPSGYEIRKNDPVADLVFYLPLDTPSNVKRFLQIVQPSLAFFIKYEYWFNYLKALKKNNVPVIMVSAVFRPSQHFFKWYGSWFRRQLQSITHFFLQNETSAQLLKGIGYTNYQISGDTRFDRVSDILQQLKPFPLITQFVKDSPVIVAGSTWAHDEKLLAGFMAQAGDKCKIIMAPHEVDEEHIRHIQELFSAESVCFSKMDGSETGARILIIDSIGILSQVYQFGHIAYIGGGFGAGIHNILEAAVFGMPVIFGPRYEKFNEACELQKLGAAFPVSTQDALSERFRFFLQQPDKLAEAAAIAKSYIASHTGAGEIILNALPGF